MTPLFKGGSIRLLFQSYGVERFASKCSLAVKMRLSRRFFVALNGYRKLNTLNSIGSRLLSTGSHSDFGAQLSEQTVDWKDINAKIKKLVAGKPVVLFLKGTPQQPECGFSAKVVSILNKCGIGSGYTFVNVLASPVIREGIKRYSDWPTVPQLYVNGQFIGGCDILVGLYDNGELQEILPKEQPTPTNEG